MTTFALVPAAGKSTRMGRPKLALPLGGRSVLEHVILVLRQAGVADVLVVVGPHVPELAPLARSAGAHVLVLAEETREMRATVEQGLRWIEEHFRPAAADDWLLVPADHPTLDAGIVEQLLRAHVASPGHSILIPTFQGRRGHPALIGWEHVSGVRAMPPGQGLNVYLRQRASETLEVSVECVDVLLDLDTPEDYERLKARYESVRA
jgi:molybdenum cofactor cytidylyltransferase